jgi:replication-associated recombination protein RarA
MDKYRPQSLDDVIGQDKAIKTLKRLDYSGRCFWISGISGCGKTTLARIIAQTVADDLCIIEFPAGCDVNISDLKMIEQTFFMFGMGKRGRALVINEAHGLKKGAIQYLLGLCEDLPGHCTVIFTTTKEGQDNLFDEQVDANPLLSRCIEIPLTNQGLAKAFGEHCKRIAEAEKLDGKPIESYIKLAQNCKNNCRAMLQKIEAGFMLD